MFKRILIALLSLLIFLSVATAVTYAETPIEDLNYSLERVIVKTKVTSGLTAFSLDKFGGLMIEDITDLNPHPPRPVFSLTAFAEEPEVLLLTLTNKGKEEVLSAVSYLNSLPNIEIAELDYIVQAQHIPNDPGYANQYAPGKISLPAAWDIVPDCSAVIVGIIDSGIDYTHPDLADAVDLTLSWNFLDNNSDVMDKNTNGHGTHVAGIVGAAFDNTEGIAGVAPNVRLVALKIMENDRGPLSSAIAAVYYAEKKGIHITNNSYGYQGAPSQIFRDAIASSNQVFVAASGNNGINIDSTAVYPAAFELPNKISVASVDSSDALASSSNYGVKCVDLAAPGVSIYSTLPGNKYNNMSGTSMAAPQVAGVAALVKANEPTLTAGEIVERIIYSCDPVTFSGGKEVKSGGRLNAYAALFPITGDIAVTGVTLNKNAETIEMRDWFELTAAVAPVGVKNKRVKWSSSDETVATVSPIGLVTGVGEGVCTITAASEQNNAIFDECIVTVDGEIPIVEFKDLNFKQAVVDAYLALIGCEEDEHFKYVYLSVDDDIWVDDAYYLSLYLGKLDLSNKNISDLSGIEHFTELTELDCSYNNISELDVSALTNLTKLDCSHNLLRSLNFNSGNDFTDIVCDYNYLCVSPGSTLRGKLDSFEGINTLQYLPQITALTIGASFEDEYMGGKSYVIYGALSGAWSDYSYGFEIAPENPDEAEPEGNFDSIFVDITKPEYVDSFKSVDDKFGIRLYGAALDEISSFWLNMFIFDGDELIAQNGWKKFTWGE